MQAYRKEATIGRNGTLVLEKLPFHSGETVEVIVLPRSSKLIEINRYPLRGKPICYDNPTEPVALADWEVLK